MENQQSKFSPSTTQALAAELLKILAPIAPSGWDSQRQAKWCMDAVAQLEGINATEVAHVGQEISRAINRHQQIIPEIANRVSELRKRRSTRTTELPSGCLTEWQIDDKASRMRGAAHDQQDLDRAWRWERNQRIRSGLAVPPVPKPLTQHEIERMDGAMIKLGLKHGALVRTPDGTIVGAATMDDYQREKELDREARRTTPPVINL